MTNTRNLQGSILRIIPRKRIAQMIFIRKFLINISMIFSIINFSTKKISQNLSFIWYYTNFSSHTITSNKKTSIIQRTKTRGTTLFHRINILSQCRNVTKRNNLLKFRNPAPLLPSK